MDWQAPESNAAWVSHTISKRVCTLCHIFDYATASVLFANNKGHSARVQNYALSLPVILLTLSATKIIAALPIKAESMVVTDWFTIHGLQRGRKWCQSSKAKPTLVPHRDDQGRHDHC